jgi:hypothetical protein
VAKTCNDGYHLEDGVCLRGAGLAGGPVSSGGAFVLWLFGVVVGGAAAAGFIFYKQRGGWRLGGQDFTMQLHDVSPGQSGFGSSSGTVQRHALPPAVADSNVHVHAWHAAERPGVVAVARSPWRIVARQSEVSGTVV